MTAPVLFGSVKYPKKEENRSAVCVIDFLESKIKEEHTMPSKVFFGSARQARLEAKETLPAKLDLILEQLHLRERVNKETVVIKMHTGNNMEIGRAQRLNSS